MSETDFDCRVSFGGIVLVGQVKQFDVSGSHAVSNSEFDDNGKLKHYYGETEETTGTVDASYLGGGVEITDGLTGIGGSVVLKVNTCNDTNVTTKKQTHEVNNDDAMNKDVRTETVTKDHSSEGMLSSNKDVKVHTQQHSLEVMENKTVESKITTDTEHTSGSFCGWKYDQEVTKRHTETTTTSTEKGFFTNTVQKEKVTEDVEFIQTQTHSVQKEKETEDVKSQTHSVQKEKETEDVKSQTHSVQKEKETEEVESQTHSVQKEKETEEVESSIVITRDDSAVELEVEHALNEAGCGALVLLVKPATSLGQFQQILVSVRISCN